MAFLLRKIRKNRWYKTEQMDWLPDSELQADPLGDLVTKSNELSVYHVAVDESNLDKVIAALAANSGFLSNFDFAIFGEEIISEIGVKIKKSPGDSPDEQVNNWHSDLLELSAQKLLTLAIQIKAKSRINRINHMQVLNFIADSVSSGQINRSNIKWKSQEDLNKLDEVIAARS